MLQELLKEQTRPYHDQLEQIMFVDRIMDGSLNPAQYRQLLVTNYLSNACFEDYIFNHLSPALQDELHITNRIKLPALLKDVEELLIPVPLLPAPGNITPIAADDASLMGAIYVMEGATLGGHVIVKRLLTNPQLQALDLHYHYYQLYGAGLIDKWKQFCQVLNTRIPPAAYDKAIKSASDMFRNMMMIAGQTDL